jgi:hypothetical protein
MVFGNTFIVNTLMATTPQEPIYAMRTPRAITIAEIVKRTGLPVNEVRRFNPALRDRVAAQSALYLPTYVSEFGADIAFWRRAAPPSYVAVLNDFMRLDAGPERWDDPSFACVLSDFRQRFRGHAQRRGHRDGHRAHVCDGPGVHEWRRTLVAEFRSSDQVRRLSREAVRARSPPATRNLESRCTQDEVSAQRTSKRSSSSSAPSCF